MERHDHIVEISAAGCVVFEFHAVNHYRIAGMHLKFSILVGNGSGCDFDVRPNSFKNEHVERYVLVDLLQNDVSVRLPECLANLYDETERFRFLDCIAVEPVICLSVDRIKELCGASIGVSVAAAHDLRHRHKKVFIRGRYIFITPWINHEI